MNQRSVIPALALVLIASTCALAAALPEERFQQAQQMFENARQQLADTNVDALKARRLFHESAQAFAAIADDGVLSLNLCVNAGNAYQMAGDNARALLWYLRAERLGNTSDVRSGLASLRRLCAADPWPPERTSIGRVLMFWHYDLSGRIKQLVLLVFCPLGTIVALIGLLRRHRLTLRTGIALMLIGGAAGCSDLYLTWRPPPATAVVVEQTAGYAGDDRTYSVTAPRIVAGQEVRVLETRGQWLRVGLPSEQTCWIVAESAGVV